MHTETIAVGFTNTQCNDSHPHFISLFILPLQRVLIGLPLLSLRAWTVCLDIAAAVLAITHDDGGVRYQPASPTRFCRLEFLSTLNMA